LGFDSLAAHCQGKPNAGQIYAASTKKNDEKLYIYNEDSGAMCEDGMTQNDMQLGQKLLNLLQKGLADPLGAEVDPIAIMCQNRADSEAAFKKEAYERDGIGANLTVTEAYEVEKSMDSLTYDVKSIQSVSEAMVSTLVANFGVPNALAMALVVPKMCDWLNSVNEVFKKTRSTVEVKQFAIAFCTMDPEFASWSVSAYRFHFSSSKAHKSKYFILNRTHEKIYYWCKKATFTATADIGIAAAFKGAPKKKRRTQQ